MGDRTWLNIEVSVKDADKVRELIDPEDECEGDVNNVIFFSLSEANWGGEHELGLLKEAKIPFEAHHGDGDNYGETLIAFDGKTMLKTGASDGAMFVGVDENGNPLKDEVKKIKKHIKHAKKTAKAIQDR